MEMEWELELMWIECMEWGEKVVHMQLSIKL